MRQFTLLNRDAEALVNAHLHCFRFVVIGAEPGHERNILGMAHSKEAAYQVASENPDAAPAVYMLHYTLQGVPKWERLR